MLITCLFSKFQCSLEILLCLRGVPQDMYVRQAPLEICFSVIWIESDSRVIVDDGGSVLAYIVLCSSPTEIGMGHHLG